LSTEPQTIPSDAFGNVNKETCILYVPQAGLASYQAAYAWNDFSNIQAIGGDDDKDVLIAQLRQCIAALQADSTSTHEELTTATGRIAALVSDTVRLYTALQTAQGIQNTDSINSLNARIAKLQTELNAANTAKNDLQSQLNTAGSDKNTLQTQLNTANTTISSLQAQLTTCQNNGSSNTTAVGAMYALPLQSYPNPTSGIVYIDNPDGDEAEVYSIDGTLLLRSKAATIIDLSKYAAGAYIIKVGNKAAKVVKE
jgi:hypothetical protein